MLPVKAWLRVQTMSSSGGGSGKKKRKDRESFKNGGTWPRTRGGPVIQPCTGTILHLHKYKVNGGTSPRTKHGIFLKK